MSEPAIKTALSGTGTHRALSMPAVTAPVIAGGNVTPDTGKPLPPAAAKPDLSGIAEQLNRTSRMIGRDLRFEVDLDSGHSVIQVLDRETGEIIRQIPPEKVTPYIDANGAISVRLYDELV